MTLFHWNRTAASNGTADITCPFPEGMGAPALNDGARGMMAAVAKYRDDMAGAIVTTGTLNSYSVLSYQGFDSLADMNGQEIAFSPHVTNGDTVVFNVDFLGSKPLRSAPGVELVAGTLVLGTPYMAVYNNADGAWYLKGFYSSPYNVPFLGGMDHWDTIAPNSAFIFPQGQAISRTVYARAFARWGTTFGVGDGSTTFNVPDKRGRMSAMMDPTNLRLTAAFLANAGVIGTVGGLDNEAIAQGKLPNVALGLTGNVTVVSAANNVVEGTVINAQLGTGTPNGFFNVLTSGSASAQQISSSGPLSTGNTASMNGGVTQTGLSKLPPLIVCNYVIRVL
jgi:microcystin-dependent protein